MTAGRIEVFVNDRKVRIYAGMEVKHALIACDPSLYKDAMDGKVRVEDDNGFRVGLEGAVRNGARIFTKPALERD